MARTNPIDDGGRPRPPVKEMGSDCLVWVGGSGCAGSKRGVERNVNQRLLKVPLPPARMAEERRVKKTLRVNMRLKGSFWV
jgi:hypothetical protein